jgi:pimeloyl-ACP methyl ester carboxylesterase
MKITRTVPLSLFLSLFALVASASNSEPTSAKTQLIAVHGHHIAFHVTPGKTPAIVLDAGAGLDSSYWSTVVPELSKRTGREIITYDRSGYGSSEEVPGPWNLQSATDDLEAGLQKLGATHGVILAAHSLAGEIALTLANRHPEWLAGAVLVDANVPQYFTDDVVKQMSAQLEPAVQAAKAAPSSPEARQFIAVSASFVETSHAFHQSTWPASIPAIVIVSEKTPFATPNEAQWWRDAHAQFAQAAPNRRLVVAERSSHDVAHDRPDVIIQGVVDLAGGKP